MLVFDRPNFLSLFRFLPCSPLYTTSPFHLIQMHNCLVADVRLAGMIDTHPCFISPFLFFLIGRCSRRWSLGVQEQKIPDADHRKMKILDAFYDVEFALDQE